VHEKLHIVLFWILDGVEWSGVHGLLRSPTGNELNSVLVGPCAWVWNPMQNIISSQLLDSTQMC
jgi:hypothetical protein